MATTIQTTAPTIQARLTQSGLIELRGQYSPAMLDAFHSLPDAKWNTAANAWVCRATPMTLYRLALAGVELADGLRERAAAIVDWSIIAANLAGTAGLPQPARRKTDAWEHQLQAFHFAKTLGSSALLAMEMGTGKSLVAIDLLAEWGCSPVLILCPKSVLPVWRREFERHGVPGMFHVTILDKGTVAQKTLWARQDLERRNGDGCIPVIAINYDSARERAFAEFSTAIHWGAVVCDESHRVKHHSSLTSKYVAKLAQVADHRLCLTGTPMGQSPLDLFGQFRFLDAGVFGTSFFHFRSRYAVMANRVIPQMVTGYKNQAELSDRMGWLTYRCRAADVLDLPEKHHIDRRLSLGTKGTAIYEAMEDDLIAEIEGGVVTAANCLVKLIRLQQVTSGFLCPDEGGPIEEFDYAKLEALTELVEDMPTDEPVVVFCRFRHDLARIAQVADDLKRPYAELSGSRRDALDDHGCLAPGVKLAGVQIASGGLGIDLTAARYAIYYSLSYSLTEFDQSIARLHRPGQTRPVHYYHLIAEGTIDEAVYKALDERREIVEAVLEGLKRN